MIIVLLEGIVALAFLIISFTRMMDGDIHSAESALRTGIMFLVLLAVTEMVNRES